MSQTQLNVVERARGYATLMKELGLSTEEVGQRVGRSKSTVESLVRVLNLSEEILGFLENEKLGLRHARTLLTVKDLEVRGTLARTAVAEGWSVGSLDARVHGREEKPKQDLDETSLEVATAWGDVLGLEVGVRTLPHGGGFRVEVVFTSSKAAFATAVRLGDAVSLLQAQTAEGISEAR
jgi:ParB-like chromosome segregation protein Spo0J